MEKFTSVLIQTAEKSIPNKIATIRPNEYPWINGLIRKLIRKRKRLYRWANWTNVQQVWQNFKKTRNTVINEIRKSKVKYFSKLSDQLNEEKINPKLFWKISKQLLNLDLSTSSIPPLNVNGDIFESDLDKATALNSFFATQSTLDDRNASLPAVGNTDHQLLDSITITNQEVVDVLTTLNVSKFCGPDSINPRLLKEGPQYLQIPLTYIFNASLSHCRFPNAWKKSKCDSDP